jgi:hypothetical protein
MDQSLPVPRGRGNAIALAGCYRLSPSRPYTAAMFRALAILVVGLAPDLFAADSPTLAPDPLAFRVRELP